MFAVGEYKRSQEDTPQNKSCPDPNWIPIQYTDENGKICGVLPFTEEFIRFLIDTENYSFALGYPINMSAETIRIINEQKSNAGKNYSSCFIMSWDELIGVADKYENRYRIELEYKNSIDELIIYNNSEICTKFIPPTQDIINRFIPEIIKMQEFIKNLNASNIRIIFHQ